MATSNSEEQQWRKLLMYVERWMEDEDLFPRHTCRMALSVVREPGLAGGRMTLEAEYVHGSKRFTLRMAYENCTRSLREIIRKYPPGEEDAAGLYWQVSSDTEFVAFEDMPDIKTAVLYIDTVYTQ